MIEHTLYFYDKFHYVFSVTSSITTRQTIPKFLRTPTNVTVHRGELAELMCHIQNLGPKTVKH